MTDRSVPRRTSPVVVAVGLLVLGAAATLGVGVASGMGVADVWHLTALMLPAAAVTVLAVAAARRLLKPASFRARLAAIALVAVVSSLANLGVLSRLMFVSAHDAGLVVSLLLYSTGAGLAAALLLARAPTEAVDRLVTASQELADGRLAARVGDVGGGPELDRLARAFDEMAEALERATERERSTERRRRDLVTAVSHDLRTPLARLRAITEAIDDRVVDDPSTLRRYVGEMSRSVDTLVDLVDDLFELVQLDAGAIEAETERAVLEDVIGSAVATCEHDASEKRIALERSLDGAGAAACSPRLVRVLQNLLQNAIRHTPPDGSIRVEARKTADDAVEIAVVDTGEGIAPESLPRVFEPFFRGDASRTGTGSGLGLAIAKRIVDALGGEITVESAPDRGTRFAVRLPAS